MSGSRLEAVDCPSVADLACRSRKAKLRLLQMHFESGVGHLGGNLSSLDLLLAIYHDILTSDDQFVLSKGHSAGALYVALWSVGRLTDDDLKQFHRDGTRMSAHPPAQGIEDVLFATGSLGHGVGLAAGLAMGRRFQRRPGRAICLTSDGEWNEGSMWEALIFAKHQDLTNQVIIVDENGLQGFGSTTEVANIAPLADKFRAFGCTTLQINGHDQMALMEAMETRPDEGPLVIVAKTIKGCGVSFMENRMEWHYLPMTAAQYESACVEVANT